MASTYKYHLSMNKMASRLKKGKRKDPEQSSIWIWIRIQKAAFNYNLPKYKEPFQS